MNNQIVFVRHSQSQVDPSRSPAGWSLTEIGRARCLDLARWLEGRALSHIVTSTEAKAAETGQIIADHLSVTCTTFPGLQETDYGDVPFYPAHADFVAHVRRGFEHPDQVVFGAESFNAAADRFAAALSTLLEDHPHDSIAVVTHGRVLSTFFSRFSDQSALDIWQSLTMPTAIICDRYTLAPIDYWFVRD